MAWRLTRLPHANDACYSRPARPRDAPTAATPHDTSISTQVWWGFLILKAVYAMATGDEEARKNEAKNA